MRVPAERLRALAHAAFEAVGVPPEDARAGGDVLWTGEMMGISTHGVRRIVFYVQRILDGAIEPRPEIALHRGAPGVTVVDGGNGLGPVVGSRGVEEAMRLAASTARSA